MMKRIRRAAPAVTLLLATLTLSLASCGAGHVKPEKADAQLAFGIQMAKTLGMITAPASAAAAAPALPGLGGLGGLLGGGALCAFGWIGTTTIVLCLPVAERSYAVRGQNRALVDFAELIAERVAQHKS